MVDRSQILEGMVVRSSDGRELGRVLACGDRSFVVEKGLYFPTDYVARYDDVADVSRGEIRLSRRHEELAQGERASEREGALGESFTFGLGTGFDAPPGGAWGRGEEDEDRRRDEVRGDEREAEARRNLADPGWVPPTYGDEGGGGLL